MIQVEKPDLLHAHGVEDTYALAIYKYTIPKVLTLQSLYEDYNSKNPVKRYSAPRLIEYLEKKALKGFQEVIVKSKQFADVVHYYHPQLNCHIIPNTLSPHFVTIGEYQKQSNKLAFVGTICERKGFHVIRQALELIDSKQIQLELHVYGDGGDQLYIEEEFKKLNATGHSLVNHGCVDAKMLSKELASANLLIAPSYAETFGNQVIEGILCRCHCVVSDDTGMADNVRKYGHGTIVPQRDSLTIAKVIQKQVKNGISEEEMQKREQVRDAVIGDLGPRKVAHQLIEIYKKQK